MSTAATKKLPQHLKKLSTLPTDIQNIQKQFQIKNGKKNKLVRYWGGQDLVFESWEERSPLFSSIEFTN